MLVFTAFYAASMSAKFVTDAIKAEVQNTTQDQEEFSNFCADRVMNVPDPLS